MDRSSSFRSWLTTRMAPGKRSSSSSSHRLAGAVEVVGGLVEDHQFGLLEEHPHEVDPPALAPGE